MQLLAKFKEILHVEFRATLNFRKFKVALNPMFTQRAVLLRWLKTVSSTL